MTNKINIMTSVVENEVVKTHFADNWIANENSNSEVTVYSVDDMIAAGFSPSSKIGLNSNGNPGLLVIDKVNNRKGMVYLSLGKQAELLGINVDSEGKYKQELTKIKSVSGWAKPLEGYQFSRENLVFADLGDGIVISRKGGNSKFGEFFS